MQAVKRMRQGHGAGSHTVDTGAMCLPGLSAKIAGLVRDAEQNGAQVSFRSCTPCAHCRCECASSTSQAQVPVTHNCGASHSCIVSVDHGITHAASLHQPVVTVCRCWQAAASCSQCRASRATSSGPPCSLGSLPRWPSGARRCACCSGRPEAANSSVQIALFGAASSCLEVPWQALMLLLLCNIACPALRHSNASLQTCCPQPVLTCSAAVPEALLSTQVFGPVMCITRFSSDAEAISLANDCAFGLGAAVFSRSRRRAQAFVSQLQVSAVFAGCNTSCRSFKHWDRPGTQPHH